MKSTAKANAWVRNLKNIIGLRLGSSYSIREAQDANQWPMLFISQGNEAASNPVVAIRISAVDAVSKDIFGNSLVAFAPHLCEVGYELNATGKPIFDCVKLANIYAELFKLGIIQRIKEIANTTAVTESSLNAVAGSDVEFDIYWPTKGN